ncbi:MAG: hypothetical protein U5K69_14885 [Balneolaceae bacterium]|nr:hypothetical protein [Balneolaceae bacterium]
MTLGAPYSIKALAFFWLGGAGVTPFAADLRDLYERDEIDGNKLIFSNKTEKDIILEDEFRQMLGDSFINVITDEPTEKYTYLDGFIDKAYLEKQINDFDQTVLHLRSHAI